MPNNNHRPSVLMIALDAAEPRLVERWINDGTLPNLGKLRKRGGYCRLSSTADWLAGSPWPTFYTGTPPSDHGLYHFLEWRADQMGLVQVSPDWLPLRPFWRDLGDAGLRVIAVDMPMTFPPEPFKGMEIYGWATHDRLIRECMPTSHPPSLIDNVRKEFGLEAIPLGDEVWGILRPKSLLQLRDQLNRATSRVAELAEKLMTTQKWDLFMVAFAATHRGGHKLWDLSGAWGLDDRAELPHALRDVYVACDAAVGKLVESVSDDVAVLVFSLHGMGPNTSRSSILPEMLNLILGRTAKYGRTSQTSNYLKPLRRVKELTPPEWRYTAFQKPPLSILYSLYQLLHRRTVGKVDWTRTSATSLVADLQGYIRINLHGREAAGIVQPNKEYDQLCRDLAKELRTFVDADTGKPIVESVIRIDQLFSHGRRRDYLPDLVVRWVSSPAARHRAIVSSRYERIPWVPPSRNPDGRSGNHRHEGFLLAIRDGIEPDSRIKDAHILDLAPSIYALFNIPKPPHMCGTAIAAITHRKSHTSQTKRALN